MFIYSINSVRALQQDIVIKSGVFKPLSTKFLINKKKKVMLCETLEEGRNRSFTIESLRNTNLGNLYYLVWEMKGLGDICYRVPNTI